MSKITEKKAIGIVVASFVITGIFYLALIAAAVWFVKLIWGAV